MSLSLKKVELSNIRLHKSFTFVPAAEGITALSGPTGAGKSTILDSIAWALYGTRPSGVSKVIQLLHEGTDLGKESCFARVELIVDEIWVKVERRIVSKAGSVECEVWEKKDEADNWDQVAGPGVSKAEPYVRKRLGMDEAGFLAAVFVQQKQVDQLINAGPKDRGLVIERLTGISSITAALTEARQHNNLLRKELQRFNMDPEKVVQLDKQLQSHKVKCDKLKSVMETSLAKVKAAQAQVDEVSNLVTEVEQVDASNEARRERLTHIDATLEQLSQRFEEASAERDQAKARLGDGFSGSLSDLKNELANKQAESRTLERKLGATTAERNSMNKQVETLSKFIQSAPVDNAEAAQAALDDAKAKLEKASQSRTGIVRRMDEARAEARKLGNAMTVISSHDGECPTCLQTVESPERALGALSEQKGSQEALVGSGEATLVKLDEVIQRGQMVVQTFTKLVDAFTQLERCLARVDELDTEGALVAGNLKSLGSEIATLEKSVNIARDSEEARATYEAIHRKVVALSDEREALTREKNQLREESDKKRPTRKALSTLREELAKASADREKFTNAFRDAREECRVLMADAKGIQRERDQAKSEMAKYEELRVSVEVTSSSVAVLEEFRENRIKVAIPVLEQYASEFLNRFTDGYYIRLKLDNKFAATVVRPNGVERPVGLSSGGELSAAGLALRLAISMLLNGGSSHSLILLDEVLASQDPARAELIVNTIKDTCHGQIVMISHLGNTADVADKVVQL